MAQGSLLLRVLWCFCTVNAPLGEALQSKDMRVGTLNVQSARGGNLEGCCRGLAALNIDVAVLTETKLHDNLYTRVAFGYEVLASKAASASVGGVALAIRTDRGKSWDVEDYSTYGPNVIACTWFSGTFRRRLIGVYIPSSEYDGTTLNFLSEALEETQVPAIVLGDLNANVRETGEAGRRGPLDEGGPRERRQAEILSILSSFTLQDVGRGFRQKPQVGTWTWSMWRGEERIRSTLDYVLSTGGTRFTRHRVRNVPYARTDHRAVYADFTLEPMKTNHRRIAKRDSTFPIPPPAGVDRTAADIHFAELVASIPKLDARAREEVDQRRAAKKDQPHWISEDTWQMIRRKGELRSKRPTRDRRRETRRLKKSIKKALAKDREIRLTKAIQAVEEAMSRDIQEGWQLLSRWYKRADHRGLAISHESLRSVEHEYGSLYASTQAEGEMLPVELVAGQFQVPDHVPEEAEIRVALGRLKSHKAPGPSGLSVDVLKGWAEEGGAKWQQVVSLVQWCVETGEVPQAFKYGTLVLIPKAEQGKYRGIALLESVYKLISGLINNRVTTSVRYHDSIHGFRAGRSCSTAILEAKLEMQRARRSGQVYYQVFLDLSKAYDTVDRDRLRLVLQAYGIGPRLLRFLDNSWEGSGVVPRKLGRYGRNLIRTERGVKQGDIPSPTFFNLMVDLVIRAEEASRIGRQGENVRVAFYADDGRIGGVDPVAVQSSLTSFVDLFARMGLQMNAAKTEAMVSTPVVKTTKIREGAYIRKLRGTGPEYAERSTAIMQCPIAECGQQMQKRSLARHFRNQHPGMLPPRLDLEDIASPERPRRQVYSVERFQGRGACPVTGCAYECATSTQLRRHFMYRHADDNLQVIGDGSYVKCPGCSKMVKEPISEQHRQSKLCRAGTLRNAARRHQQVCIEARSAPVTLFVGDQALRQVGEFKYLGRVISHDDSDLPACVRNLQRARAKWADLSKLLRTEGASSKLSARFYLVVVSAVLLYGSETWVVTKRIEALLTSFHNRCARTIARTYFRKTGEDEWVYPSVAETLRRANLQPLAYYLQKRRANFKRYAESRDLYRAGDGGQSVVQPFTTLWTQYNQLENRERPGVHSGL